MIEFMIAIVVFVLIGVFLLREDAVSEGGLYFWHRGWLDKNGARASGVVLDHAAHSPGMARRTKTHLVDLVIEWSPEGEAPRRVRLRYKLADGAMSNRAAKGMTLPLRYDPRQPSRVLIDWSSIAGPPPEPSREQREADRARQEALLRGQEK